MSKYTIDIMRSINEALAKESEVNTADDLKNVPPRTATGVVPESRSTRNRQKAKKRNKATESIDKAKRSEFIKGAKKESVSAPKVSKKHIKLSRKTESVEDIEDITVDVCPVCGSKDFDAKSGVCPICGEPTNKYIAADPETVEDVDQDYTTITIDGEEKILIDEEGNTVVASPDIVNNVLDEGTHELVLDANDTEDDTVSVDTGIATMTTDGESVMESDDPENADTVKIAYMRIDEPINEIVDLLSEDNENNVRIKDDEEGTVLSVILPDIEVVTESEDGNQEVTSEDNYKVDIELEELPNGTLIHIEDVDNVDDLVDIVNELLPEDSEIVENTKAEDKEVEDTTEEDESDETKYSEEDVEDKEEEVVEESMKRKLESGTMSISRNGKVESYKCRTVRTKRKVESELPETNTGFTKIAGKDRKVSAKSNIDTKTSETNMKEMSVLENRKDVKNSEKLRGILNSLGCDTAKLESDEGIKMINELVKCCGNIKEYRSGIKTNKDGSTVTMESVKPKVRIRTKRK